MKLPKIGIKVGQYLWCWLIIILIAAVPQVHEVTRGLYIYLYAASVSLLAIGLIIRKGGCNVISLLLCVLEAVAIIWTLPSLWANLDSTPNFFHTHFRASLEYIYMTQIAVLSAVGFYGLTKLVWLAGRHLLGHRDSDSIKSILYPFFHDERRRQRR